MLRHFAQHSGGVKVYTRQLLDALIRVHGRHELVLLYRDPDLVGGYGHHPGVEEVALPASSLPSWDQVAVPRAVRTHGIDVLFNPKYSIPLRAGSRCAWVCHGLDWYLMPEASAWLDRLSHRFLVPLYAQRADAVIAVSETTRLHLLRYLHLPPDRVHTVYSGVNDIFRKPIADATLEALRAEYRLPEAFVLYCGAVYPPKNFRRLVQAYARVGPRAGVSLVIAGGTNRFLSADELREPERLGLGSWVHWLGWIPHENLPPVYRLARALLLPSLYESVGLPLLEAMCCGCPIVTADRHGTKEFGAGAAVLVDPESVDSIAAGLEQVLTNATLRGQLIAAGRDRSSAWTWDRCAAGVLKVLEQL